MIEFLSSLEFPSHFQLELTIRIALAAFCGALIGYERKNRLKEAGVRTHLIVSMGAALMMIVSKYGFMDVLDMAGFRLDPSRVASQIVSGIGFLGAGMIFVRKQTVNGLTTAAGVWATAGIGMAIGSGLYLIGFIATVMIILLQLILRKHSFFFHIPVAETLEIHVKDEPNALRNLQEILRKKHISVVNLKVEHLNDSVILLDLLVRFPSNFSADELLVMFNDLDYVITIEF